MENNTETATQQQKVVGRPFKKGQSGNPGGRPKGSISLTTILREKLSEGDGERAKQLVEELLLRAGEKSDPLMKEILDRTEGKVPQATDITSNGESIQPVLVEIINAKPETTDDSK